MLSYPPILQKQIMLDSGYTKQSLKMGCAFSNSQVEIAFDSVVTFWSCDQVGIMIGDNTSRDPWDDGSVWTLAVSRVRAMDPSPQAFGLAHKLRAERYKKELQIAERKVLFWIFCRLRYCPEAWVGQNENLSWANKDISRKLFEANQRGRQLAVTLGFRNIFEADAVISHNPEPFNHFRIQQQALRLQQLEKESEEQHEINSGLQQAHQGTVKALQRVEDDNKALTIKLRQLQDRLASSFELIRCAWFIIMAYHKFSTELSLVYQSHLPIPPLRRSSKYPT